MRSEFTQFITFVESELVGEVPRINLSETKNLALMPVSEIAPNHEPAISVHSPFGGSKSTGLAGVFQ